MPRRTQTKQKVTYDQIQSKLGWCLSIGATNHAACPKKTEHITCTCKCHEEKK